MSEKRQILDVTYGTFSCRLEGFDDSVATMKQVAAYFEDRAAQSGLPDVPPQQTDLAALTKLTGDSAEHPVEATLEDGKISLSRDYAAVDEDEDEDEDETSISEAEETSSVIGDLTEVDLVEDDLVEDDAGDADMPDTDTPTDVMVQENESVAEKLQRIRNVVGQTQLETDSRFSEDLPDSESAQPVFSTNPLSLRLAELAQRNAEAAAREAGIPQQMRDDDAMASEDLEDLATLDSPRNDEVGPVMTQDAALNLANIVQDDDLNLQDEVAEVERQIDDRNKRQELVRATDAAVSRILMQTDTHLNEPETRRQRASIAQLKAAVAATEAARQLGDDGGPQKRLSAIFRHDLGEISAEENIRPKFILSDEEDDWDAQEDDDVDDFAEPTEEAGKAAPKSSLPPLRLVASQRIISPTKPDSAASTRLRQIAAKVDTRAAKTLSFEEFAKEHDVTDMAEMFEAAAAYTIFVGKQADFSRPQIMGLVQSTMKPHFSRRNALQAFGQLVQQGRIVKLENGRFHVASDTRFAVDGQAARG